MNELHEPMAGDASDLPATKPENIKSIQPWLNIFFLIALAVLFVLHFMSNKSQPNNESLAISPELINPGPRIAFINSDSIMVGYELVNDMRKSLESSTKRKENELKAQQKAFESKVDVYKQKLNSNAISVEIAQITEQQLMKEQQRLVDLRDQLTDALSREEYQLNVELLEHVTDFLVRYNEEKKYDAIFNFKQGTTLFIANEALDITPEVLGMLNQEYRIMKQRNTKP